MVQVLIFILVLAGCLFGSAGTLHWWNGWAYLAGAALAGLLAGRAMKATPGLAEERRAALKNAAPLDRTLIPLITFVLPLAALVLAGLDRRWGWTPPWPLWVSVAAWGVMLAGTALTYGALKANPFFSSVVRIQKDRGHRVVTVGPYRFLRHPGYSGALLYNLAGPVLLGSLPALGAGVLVGLLLVVRTVFEERTLWEGLEGYQAYCAQVRYRLVPFIW